MKRIIGYLAVLILLVGAWVFTSLTIDQPTHAAPAAAIADPGQAGPYAVGHTSLMLFDTSRPGNREGETSFNGTSRPIPVSVWYPVDPATVEGRPSDAVYPLDPLYGIAPVTHSADWEKYGIDPAFEEPAPSSAKPFPLVVMSPGGALPAWANTSTAARLASHGFVVAVMYHWGMQFWSWEPPWDWTSVEMFNRPLDMSFVLTDLLARNTTPGNLLEGIIRPGQVAAAGHSFGGYASLVLAGGDDSVCDTAVDFGEPTPDWTCGPLAPDPRFKALALLSSNHALLHFGELARVQVPAITIGEEWDAVLDWQARAHAAISGRPSYRVDVAGTVHMSFADGCAAGHVFDDLGFDDNGWKEFFLSSCGPDVLAEPLAHQLTHKYMVAFLKTQLAGESGYQAMLTPGWALTRESAIEFFVTEKRSPQSIDADWPDFYTYFAHQPGSVQARGPKEPAKRLGPHFGPRR